MANSIIFMRRNRANERCATYGHSIDRAKHTERGRRIREQYLFFVYLFVVHDQ